MVMRCYFRLRRAACFTAILLLTFHRADACTVFTMTDGEHVLFCDNEDFSNTRTRIWFIPGTTRSSYKTTCHPEGGSATEGSTLPWGRFFAPLRFAQNDSAGFETGSSKHGCQYLGFDDGWGQGGLNDK